MTEHIALIVLLVSLILGSVIVASLLATLAAYCFGKALEEVATGIKVGFIRKSGAVAVAVQWG